MAHSVDYGSDIFDVFGGGLPSGGTREWLSEHSSNARRQFSKASMAFVERAETLHQQISESRAAQLLRNVRSKTKNAWKGNQIQVYRSLPEIQTAGLTMQRWIMAHPGLRRKYLNQEVSGYQNTFVNRQGRFVGEEQLDWRLVNDGVIHFTEDSYVLKRYQDILDDGDEPLDAFKKSDILTNWGLVKHLLEQGGEDLSSTCGAML